MIRESMKGLFVLLMGGFIYMIIETFAVAVSLPRKQKDEDNRKNEWLAKNFTDTTRDINLWGGVHVNINGPTKAVVNSEWYAKAMQFQFPEYETIYLTFEDFLKIFNADRESCYIDTELYLILCDNIMPSRMNVRRVVFSPEDMRRYRSWMNEGVCPV